ncbi:MAG: protoheme IX farnesyltransferase [Ignavibacteriales bacterium]|nr:protoheme IX farnesyltransferase [Ignavibacteriales bacterium]
MKNDGEAIATRIRGRSKVLDYIELTKPELTGLSVLTALCGFYLASTSVDALLLLWTALGTFLVGGGAGALNQLVERNHDALMKRTERRPLPAGRLTPSQVASFGISSALVGVALLVLVVNPLTGALGILTLVSYLFLYTPSKRFTQHSTLVGAIPGALPPVMGWTAASNEINTGTWVLFGILFFWQMPHFLSLAWMYRKDYARAGYRMLTIFDEHGIRTSRHILVHCILLVSISLAATVIGLTGWMYAAGAVILGTGFLTVSFLFLKYSQQTSGDSSMKANKSSRQIFFASLLYLPALMFLMTVDKI